MSSGGGGRLVAMAPAADPTPALWAVVVVHGGDHEGVLGRLVGPCPDLDTVDALARLQLAARRLGFSIRLDEVHPQLSELLDLAGLRLLLLREAGGQPEDREPIRIEETLDGGDTVP